ncbi:MAG: hypothetical protein PHD47_00845 [Acholeplasmataceae bacterium]|nr:hypothetical protein [Acholeplasmataceae bacterium]
MGSINSIIFSTRYGVAIMIGIKYQIESFNVKKIKAEKTVKLA